MGYQDIYKYLQRKKALGSPITRDEMSMLAYPSLLAESQIKAANSVRDRELRLRESARASDEDYRNQQSLIQQQQFDTTTAANEKARQIQQDQYEESMKEAGRARQQQTYSDLAQTGLMTYGYGRGQGWWGNSTTNTTPSIYAGTDPSLTSSAAGGGTSVASSEIAGGGLSSAQSLSDINAGAGATGLSAPTTSNPSLYSQGLGKIGGAGTLVSAAIIAQNMAASKTNRYDEQGNRIPIGALQKGQAANAGGSQRLGDYVSFEQPYEEFMREKEGLPASKAFLATQAANNKDSRGYAKNAPRGFYDSWINVGSPGTSLAAARVAGYKYDPEDPYGSNYKKYQAGQTILDPLGAQVSVLSGDNEQRNAFEDVMQENWNDFEDWAEDTFGF